MTIKNLPEGSLGEAIQTMIDCYCDNDLESIDLKSKNWFSKLTWIEKNEENFIKTLSKMMAKEWKDLLQYPTSDKKTRDKAAREFVLNYGAKTRKLRFEDFLPIIPTEQIKDTMSKEEQKKFIKWMFGQTAPIGGFYTWDLKRYLEQQ